MTEKGKCCFCGKDFNHYGNNPFPYFMDDEEKRCCDKCNSEKVVPARTKLIQFCYEYEQKNK